MPSVIGVGKRVIRSLVRAANPEWEGLLIDYHALRETPRDANDLRWQPVRRCPDVRLDAGGVAIGRRLYVFGGFASHERVLSVIDIFDMRACRWVARWSMPLAMAQTHIAIASDGMRYVYAASGQLGNHCRPPTRAAFVLDTATGRWGDLPPLPEARYAATAALWHGRLHVLGGSREDRHTAARDHWSLAVENGRAYEPEWRAEPPVPIGGPHRASAVVDERLYVFGGQLGDWTRIPGDPDCRCMAPHITEEHYADCFVLERGAVEWHRVAPMPLAVSHTESSVLPVDRAVYLFGGQCSIDLDGPAMGLAAAVQRYDAPADRWSLIGTLPYRVKTIVIGHYDGWVHAVGGQRDRGPRDPRPGPIVGQSWRARLE
jgi:hypothetical protein